jgi:hypothetical protein
LAEVGWFDVMLVCSEYTMKRRDITTETELAALSNWKKLRRLKLEGLGLVRTGKFLSTVSL